MSARLSIPHAQADCRTTLAKPTTLPTTPHLAENSANRLGADAWIGTTRRGAIAIAKR